MSIETDSSDGRLFRALHAAVPAASPDPAAPKVDEVARFVAWAKPFLHAWSHIRVSAVAHHIGDGWIGRAVVAVLRDAEDPPTKMSTDMIAAGQVSVPIADLPAFLMDVWNGKLDAARSPFGVPLVLAEGTGEPLRNLSSWPRRAASSSDDLHEQVHRYDLEYTSKEGLAPFFTDKSEGYRWIERERRRFEGLGHGPLEVVAERLGVPTSRTKFYNEHLTIVLIVAPLPLVLGASSQSPDRTRVRIPITRGSRIMREHVVVTMESPGAAAATTFDLPEDGVIDLPTPPHLKPVLNILYCGEHVQRRGYGCLPPARVNPRYIAHTAFERTTLLEDGLEPKEGLPKEKNADAFERSVAHVLGLLGFSVSWWGPHKGALPVPQEQADLLAWSSDNAVVLVVDCSLEVNARDKAAKVHRRAVALGDVLTDKMGKTHPRVVPVIAYAVPDAGVPSILRRAEDGTPITIFALDHMRAALEKLREGRPHDEIAAGLPEALRMGFEGQGRYRLSVDPYV